MIYRPTLKGLTDEVIISKLDKTEFKKNDKIMFPVDYSVVIFQNKKFIGFANNCVLTGTGTREFVFGVMNKYNKKPYGQGLENLVFKGLFSKKAKNVDVYFVLHSISYISSSKYIKDKISVSISGKVTDFNKFVTFYLSLGFKPGNFGAVLTGGAFIVGLKNLVANDHQMYNDALQYRSEDVKVRFQKALEPQMGFEFTKVYAGKERQI